MKPASESVTTMDDNGNSTRFVLTGQGRSGSNLLKYALKHNPSIYMTGEYYNRNVFPESVEQDGASRAQAFFRIMGIVQWVLKYLSIKQDRIQLKKFGRILRMTQL